MRRRRGGGRAPAEACGVWLDTAELKRGPVQPLSARVKAATRIPERKQSPLLLPQPGTRQSTIPTFFRAHKDERDKENSRPTPCTPNKDCKDSGAPLAACPVKILALPQLEEPLGAEQGLQGTSQAWKTPVENKENTPLELQGESRRQSRASRGAGGDSWCCSSSQGSEQGRITPHRNKSRLFPGETASRSRKPQPCSRAGPGAGPAGAGNTNPAPGAAPRGVCCSPQSPGPAQPLREWGQSPGGSCRELFCQDSQGNRVIAHRDREQLEQLELGSESLFTQDSEGNRVIKHW
ncbi:aurora kinase A- and ninein-interacting protein [Sylvia borin]